MIQLNLLPDVKLEYIRAQRTHALVMAISFVVILVSLALLGGIFATNVLQKKHLADLNNDITTKTKQLKSKNDIDKVLTVQNQLASIDQLHSQKPAASRVFTYLNQITPSNVSISTFNIDFTASTVTVSGGADSISTINKYVDTLKFTTYNTSADKNTQIKAFSNVVLGSFSLNDSSTSAVDRGSYSVAFSYDPVIFDIAQKINLKVPKLTTTRAGLDNPTDLFQSPPSTTTKGTQ